MKMKKSLLFLVLIFFVTTQGFAIGPQFRLSAGISNPMGPDLVKDVYKSGVYLGGDLELGLPMTNIGIVGSVHYSRFPLDNDKLLEMAGVAMSGVDVEGGSTSSLALTANLKLGIGPPIIPVKPFITGGFGYYRLSIGDASVSYQGNREQFLQGDSTDKMGINIGAGVDINLLLGFSLFADARYHLVFQEDDNFSYIPIRVGISFL
ncbi:outer membrane beta-barrel protein [candidate division KSB1 bacterium]|nr:outer membrane beta-barrel protein [candidate division KSB1 bacterium]